MKKGISAAWLVCLPLASLPASAELLDFENLPDSAAVTNEYAALGVSFTNTLALTAGLSLNQFDYPPHSGTGVVSDDGTGPINIDFDKSSQIIDAWFTYSTPVTVTAFNASGGVLGVFNSPTAENIGTSTQILLGIDGVRRLVIAGAENSTFVMDDLSFTASLLVSSNINTAQPFYLASGLGTTVNPVF